MNMSSLFYQTKDIFELLQFRDNQNVFIPPSKLEEMIKFDQFYMNLAQKFKMKQKIFYWRFPPE